MNETERMILNVVRAKGTQVIANTSIATKNDITRVVLHSTEIAVINHRKRTIKFNSGGYKTNITKSRMNCVLDGLGIPKYVVQRKGEWFIDDVYRGETPFRDGITIDY